MFKLPMAKQIGGLVVLVAIILFGVWAYLGSQGQYSVVYATSGEIYIGKLATFPRLILTDAHALITAKDVNDPTKAVFRMNPFSSAVWATDKVYLNPEQVIFYGPLNADSSALKGILSKDLSPQEGEQVLPTANPK